MFCPQCGRLNDEEYAFCKRCGASMRRGKTPAATLETPVSAPLYDAPAAGQEIRYAGFGWRFLAVFLDWILISIVSILFVLTLGVAAGAGEDDIPALVVVIGVGMSWLYEALLVSSSYQATLGKKAVGIVVTDLQGRRISFLRATGRHFGKIVSEMLLLIGYLIQPFTPKRQTLHDIMAGCLVLRKVPR